MNWKQYQTDNLTNNIYTVYIHIYSIYFFYCCQKKNQDLEKVLYYHHCHSTAIVCKVKNVLLVNGICVVFWV